MKALLTKYGHLFVKYETAKLIFFCGVLTGVILTSIFAFLTITGMALAKFPWGSLL